MPYQPILATLGYVFSEDRNKVLMIRRDKNETDQHFGKYNGLGGKIEANEDVVSGMCREIHEEANITCKQLQLAGTISWPGFGKNGEDWFAFIFRILKWSGEPATENKEGSLHWVNCSDIANLNLWEGDKYFIPLVLNFSQQTFHGIMPYLNNQPVSWHVELI